VLIKMYRFDFVRLSTGVGVLVLFLYLGALSTEIFLSINPCKFLQGENDGTHAGILEKKPPRILVNLGLMKTGTSTLHSFLRHEKVLDMNSTHWRCKKSKDLILLQENQSIPEFPRSDFCASLIDAAVRYNHKPFDFIAGSYFTQMDLVTRQTPVQFIPQVGYLDELLSAYKPDEVVFALTTRSTESWVGSIFRWSDSAVRLCRLFQGKDFDGFVFERTNISKFAEKFNDRTTMEKCWYLLSELKDWHENRVRLRTRETGHTLIELNLLDPNLLKRSFDDLTLALTRGKFNASARVKRKNVNRRHPTGWHPWEAKNTTVS